MAGQIQSFASSDQNSPSSPISVPLPTEIPQPPDFSSLPPSILHSGTVETLLGLNDDLMARLKVNLRRNSVLEQQILEHEKLESELAHINQALSTQLDLLNEKALRSDGLNRRLQTAEEQVGRLKTAMRANSAFRRRVMRWVRPLLTRLSTELAAEKLRAGTASEKLSNRDAQLSDVRARLQDAITHIQNQDKIFLKDQSKLVEQYEDKQTRSQKEIEKLQLEMKIYKDKATRLDSAVSARIEAENRIIYLERRAQELESRLQKEVAEFQGDAGKYRLEAKALALNKIELEKKLKELEDSQQTQSASFERLQDQFESLRTLWADAQKKLEAARTQHETLNLLNQELSRELKEQKQGAAGETGKQPGKQSKDQRQESQAGNA